MREQPQDHLQAAPPGPQQRRFRGGVDVAGGDLAAGVGGG
jgi:hypothetical protein